LALGGEQGSWLAGRLAMPLRVCEFLPVAVSTEI